RPVILGPNATTSVAGLPARPELLPGIESPGPFAGGAVPGPLRSATAVRIIAPGVVVAALEHTRAGGPRGGIVRVLPTQPVAARRAAVPIPGHPSLQLTTISRAPAPRGSPRDAPDTMAPAISCQTIEPGWHADNVTIGCSADDPGSGLASHADAAFTLSTHVASGDENATAATDSRTICDVAGNCAVASAVALSVDRKAPTVSCDAPDRSW